MGYNTPKQTISQFQLKDRYARQYLSFAGKSSKDFLLYLSGPGVYDSPAADVESTSVPGRNGDILTENAKAGRRRYQNVDIKYKAFFFNGLPAKTAAVKAWLLSPVGYQKLQDTYDPDFFRMAVCKDALAFDVTAQKAAEMELAFNCKPQRWSVDGQRTIRLDGRSTLRTPSLFLHSPSSRFTETAAASYMWGKRRSPSTASKTMCCSTVRRTMLTTLPASAMRPFFRMTSRNCRRERHRSHGQAVSRRWKSFPVGGRSEGRCSQ